MGLPKEHRFQGEKGPPMKKRAKLGLRAQAGADLLPTAQQLLLPMIEGMVHTRRELFAWIQQVGINALQQL
jgi:hypothetical protein